MKISVIVPAFNEEKLLGESLRQIKSAVAGFSQRGWEIELIVCDNNSTDRTAELARAAGATVVFEPVNQIARARNTGARMASGDWLVFVDADSSPSAELFAEVAEHIASCKCLAGGATIRMKCERLLPKFVLGSWNWTSRIFRWAAGSFVFCEQAAFRELGGFNEKFYASEEIDFSRRLKRLAKARGKRMVIIHRHPIETSPRKLHLYTTREYLAFTWRNALSGGRSLTRREECFPWYDGRR